MWCEPDKCPLCGALIKYRGLLKVECYRAGCENYSPEIKKIVEDVTPSFDEVEIGHICWYP